MKYIWKFLTMTSLMAALLACQPAGSVTQIPTQSPIAQSETPGFIPETGVTPDLGSTSENTEMSTPITPDASAEQIIALVKQHLAKQLSISVDQITLSEVKPVVWRDAGLGCPKPGVDYNQVETPGYRIVLEAQGQAYNYHTDETQRFVPCRT